MKRRMHWLRLKPLLLVKMAKVLHGTRYPKIQHTGLCLAINPAL